MMDATQKGAVQRKFSSCRIQTKKGECMMTNSSGRIDEIKSYRWIALASSRPAFACRLPWLVVTDFSFVGLPR